MIARLAVLLLLAPVAFGGAQKDLADVEFNDAIKQLSHYPAGHVPVDPVAINAIALLGERGERSEISLLRSLVDHERAEIRRVAVDAIGKVRVRQRAYQRAGFAKQVPRDDDLAEEVTELAAAGTGKAEAECRVYARRVLGDENVMEIGPAEGDADALLAQGKPRQALAVLHDEVDADSRMLAARALEDLGHTRAAVRIYARQAAGGDIRARDALVEFGVDGERLLLGSLASRSEAEILEVLVRDGEDRTIAVLAERADSATPSEAAVAIDALARMLDPGVRTTPLPPEPALIAEAALQRASTSDDEAVRQIALEALHEG
jgi:hypothetical protein